MITRNNILSAIESNNFSTSDLVSILILLLSKININSFKGMAESENKTPNGIRKSNKYLKIEIGSKTFAVKGLANNNLPF